MEDMAVPELVEKIRNRLDEMSFQLSSMRSSGLDHEEEIELRRVAETAIVKTVRDQRRGCSRRRLSS